MEVELEPRASVAVRYTLRVPATAAERSYHCAIGFRSLPPLAEDGGTAMRTAVRMIGVIYAIVGNPVVSGEIRELKLEPVPNGTNTLWRAIVVMENSGFMFYR